MAKEQTDRTTLDLFADERRQGARKQTHYPVMNSLELISEINYGAIKYVAYGAWN